MIGENTTGGTLGATAPSPSPSLIGLVLIALQWPIGLIAFAEMGRTRE